MQLQDLYTLATQKQIPVLPYPMKDNGSMSLLLPGGSCCIGMDPSVMDGRADETNHLAHELGHCCTGSFYNFYSNHDVRQRHENRADKWAIKKLIPLDEFDDAIANGCSELWELADHFRVPEDLMRKAICYYVNGNMAAELYF